MLVTAVVVIAAVLLAIRIYSSLTTGKCTCKKRLDGKTVIVTGANCGIGREAARDFAARGAKVILACRDLLRADEARDAIVATTGNRRVIIRQLDLASLESVRHFVNGILETEDRLDVLVNNAGAGGLPKGKTADGLELGMQVNHFGPFLLTCLLLDLLKKTGNSRIIMVSSAAHNYGNFDVDNINIDKNFNGFHVYCYSKLCNIFVAEYLAKNLSGTGVTANSLHPGVVRTEVFRRVPSKIIRVFIHLMIGLLFKTPMQGAQTIIHLAVSDEGGIVSGKYFVDCKETRVGRAGRVRGLAEKVWQKSEELVKLAPHERPFRK